MTAEAQVVGGGDKTHADTLREMKGWRMPPRKCVEYTAAIDAAIAALSTQPQSVSASVGAVPSEAKPVSERPLFGFMQQGDWAISSGCAIRVVDARMAYGWNECRKEMQEALAQQPAAVDGILARLVECRDWFDQQADAISKGSGSTWDMLQCQEQRDLCDAAIADDQGAQSGG